MMLKPFRIRSLSDTSPGVIRLTGVQYDATVRSQPDAALLYLDDDDGETILVGSSLELEQRLDEPVPSHVVRFQPVLSLAEDIDDSMHTFDIKKTPASLATWREHEAYSSKALRKWPLSSLSSRDGPASSATPKRNSTSPPAPQGQPDLPTTLEDAIKGALQGLESHVGAFAGFLQDTSSTLRIVAENTREADASAIGGIIDGFKGIFSEVGKVGRAMVEAFDPEALTHSACVSAAVVKDPTINKPIRGTKDVDRSSNNSIVPVIGQHDKVQPCGSIMAEADSSINSSAPSPESFVARVPPKEKLPFAPDRQPRVNAKLLTQSKAHATSSHVEANPPQAPSAPFAAYASLKDPWKISSVQSAGRLFGCSYCQRTKSHCRRNFSGGACQNCVSEKQQCSFLAEPTPEASEVASTVSPPTMRYHHEARRSNSDDLAAQHRHTSQQLNAQDKDLVQPPRETAKTYVQSTKAGTSRSILDLENSDPEFSTRYPPLMSLRKSKTISSLADRSRSPFLSNINPEAAISRFPSLSQIEHEARSDRRVEALSEDQGVSMEQRSYVKDSQNLWQPVTRPRLAIPVRPATDIALATPPKLPGAWPELRAEADGPTLPTSEESSGAFFDRMTRGRSPEPAPRSFRYIPAHLSHSRTTSIPYVTQRLREPLHVDTTCVPPHLRHSYSIDAMAPQLGRSNTMTTSNPAARLTRPFDPLEDARQSRDMNGLPKRSGTERYRRRPYNESFTGAGRMPWESFDHITQTECPAAARHESRPTRRDAKPFIENDRPFTGAGFGISDKVGDCVRQLRDMGYGNRSPHEASRLSIYATACKGDIVDAVEMIEEDRKAGRQHKNVGDKLGVRPFNHNDRPIFGR